MPLLSELTEAKWDSIKSNANIKKSSIFKALLGKSAGVGGAIKSFINARKAYGAEAAKSKLTFKTVSGLIDACMKLEKAFTDFLKIKDLTVDKSTMQLGKDIVAWRSELAALRAGMEKYRSEHEAELRTGDLTAIKGIVPGL